MGSLLKPTVVCYNESTSGNRINTQMGKEEAVGVFDSGVGGLTILREIVSLLPNENVIYLGDTARVPYGSKPKSTVIQYALEDARFLWQQGVKALVVACNTICSLAMGELRGAFDLPVVDVIAPAARAAVALTRSKRIGVIGTEGTINSGVYPQTIKQLDSEVEVFSKACPLFVPLVEENLLEGDIAQKVVDMYLSELVGEQIDTLVLGCTHYPLLRKPISRCVGPGVTLLDPAVAVAEELKQKLTENGLLNDSKSEGYRRFLFTSQPQKAEKLIRYLNIRVGCLEQVDLLSSMV